VKNRAAVDVLPSGAIRPSVAVTVENAPIAHDEHTRADDAITVGIRIEEPDKATPVVRGG